NLGHKLKALDSRIQQLDEVKRPEKIKHYKVELEGQTASTKLLLKLAHISKAYRVSLFSEFDLEIRGKDRVRIDGPNGSGKTTLLKIAVGLLDPDSGEVQRGINVKLGYFSQEADGLDYKASALENLLMTKASATAIYRNARRLGLTEQDLKKKLSALSRGQKAKLSFAKLLLSENHLLVLDEPT